MDSYIKEQIICRSILFIWVLTSKAKACKVKSHNQGHKRAQKY